MPEPRTILVLDTDGAPLDGVTAVVSAADASGDLRAAPTVEGIGDGFYDVTFNDGDADACTVALIDFGAGALQRYVVMVEHRRDNTNQAWAAVFTAANGSMWNGTAPAVGAYRWADGTDRLLQAPSALQLAALATGVYLWQPTLEDMRQRARIRVDPPAGSSSSYLFDRALPVPAEVDSLGADLYQRLIADPDVFSIVGTKVFPNELPQGEQGPALVYNIMTDRPESGLDTLQSAMLRAARVQVDAYAKKYKQAHALEFAVVSMLGDLREPAPGLSVAHETSRDLFDHETRNHRVSMEFTVWR
ncbi:MAG TPA: DUF3168 domain-containing protein [Archangium sp.]